MEETIKYYHAKVTCNLAGAERHVGCIALQMSGDESLDATCAVLDIAQNMAIEVNEITMEQYCQFQIEAEDGRYAI